MPRQLEQVSLAKLPSTAEDPTERRRILNILAQRRYRSRKRARLAPSSESRGDSPADSHSTSSSEEPPCTCEVSHSNPDSANTALIESPAASTSALDGALATTREASAVSGMYDPLSFFDFGLCGGGGYRAGWDNAPALSDFALPLSIESAQLQSASLSGGGTLVSFNSTPISEGFSTPPLTVSHLLPAATASTSTSAVRAARTLDDAANDSDMDRPSQRASPRTDPYAFSDETHISIPGLSLVKAHFTILSLIQRLHSAKVDLWDPHSVSPFFSAPSTPTHELPPNYRPTLPQRTVAHHPVFDLLPWPSVRERILQFMCLPQHARPPRARGDMPTVVTRIVLDQKDAAGGLRVWGCDPFDERNWEVGQVFFENWWWALSSEIVQRSNTLRKNRGEDILRVRRGESHAWQMAP